MNWPSCWVLAVKPVAIERNAVALRCLPTLAAFCSEAGLASPFMGERDRAHNDSRVIWGRLRERRWLGPEGYPSDGCQAWRSRGIAAVAVGGRGAACEGH